MLRSVYKRAVFAKMSSIKPSTKSPSSAEVNNYTITIRESKELVDAFGRETIEKAIASAPTEMVKRELEALLKEADEFEKNCKPGKNGEEMKGSECGASASHY